MKKIVYQKDNKNNGIGQDMRERIASGAWPVGSRIPTKIALCEEFRASNMTVQKALSALGREGFLVSRGRAGTFVADQPPSHSRLALVLPRHDGRSSWLRAMTQALSLLHDEHGRITVCQDMPDDLSSPEVEDLLRAVRSRRLAGVLLVTPFPILARAIRAAHPGLAVARLSGGDDDLGIHRIHLVPGTDEVLRIMAARGRRRLAALVSFQQARDLARCLPEAARAAGLACPEEWVLPADVGHPSSARSIARLLASLPAAHRPDALYIADDNLATEATWGLNDAGIRVPEDMDVLSHANLPYPPVVSVPVTWVGYDIDALMRLSAHLLGRLAAGWRPDGPTLVQPTVSDMTGARTAAVSGVA